MLLSAVVSAGIARARGYSATSTPVHDLPGEIARQRDRLCGAIWMCVLGLVPIGGALCCMGGFMVISIFLPLYQLIGNIGA